MTGARPRPLLALALATVMLLVPGCLGILDDGGGSGEPVEPAGSEEDAEPSARLAVVVVDVGQVPIEGADVTVAFDDTTRAGETDPTGLAAFDQLPEGRATVDVRADGYQDRRVRADVPATGEAEVTVTLLPERENETHVERFEFKGFFECSATWLIVTGDCLSVARAAAQEAGVDPGENATNERFTFPFEVHPGWTSLTITLSWEDATAQAGSMMRVNLEPVDRNNTEGHGPRYARAEGQSPVSLTLHPGEVHERASSEDMIPPEGGALFRARVFHLGLEDTHNPGGTEFLGAGAAFQQSFDVTVDVVYG